MVKIKEDPLTTIIAYIVVVGITFALGMLR
jgi:hypothetical protein